MKKIQAINENFINNYLTVMNQKLDATDQKVMRNLLSAREAIIRTSDNQGVVYIVGNGGSAAIASHYATDLTKNAGIRSLTFNDTSLITCFANDYGHENWVAEAVKKHVTANDMLIMISASGSSINIVNALKHCNNHSIPVITLTGMSETNKLKCANSGDQAVNLWVDSKGYNIIEAVHSVWLGLLVDSIIGEIEYGYS